MDKEMIEMIRHLINKNLADKKLSMLEKIERTDLKIESEVREYREAYNLKESFEKFVDELEDEDD